MLTLRLLALTLFLAAVTLHSALLGSVAAMLGGATVVSGVWTGQLRRSLRVQRRAAPVATWGSAVEVAIEVHNTALVPLPWLAVEELVPLNLRGTVVPHAVIALPAGGRHTLPYTVRAVQRGYYQLGPTRLALGDVLGLATEHLTIPTSALTVLPRILPVGDLRLPAALPFGPLAMRQRRGEDPARPSGVRAYQPSDGVRRIDWKATAHRQELMVRRADPAIAPETTFALAFSRTAYPARVLQNAAERAVIAVASLAVALLARKLPVGLVSDGLDAATGQRGVALRLAKGAGQRALLLELLGRLELAPDGSIWALLGQQPLPWGGTLILTLTDLTADDLPHVLAMVRRGQHVALLLLESTTGGLALAQRYGLAVWTVDPHGLPIRR